MLTGVPAQIFPGLTDAGVVTEVHPSLGSPAAVHGVDDPALLALPRLLLVAQAGHGAAGLTPPRPPLRPAARLVGPGHLETHGLTLASPETVEMGRADC